MFVTHYATTEPPKFTVEGGTRSVVGAGVAQTSERQLRTSEHFHHGTVGMDQPVLLVLTPSTDVPSSHHKG